MRLLIYLVIQRICQKTLKIQILISSSQITQIQSKRVVNLIELEQRNNSQQINHQLLWVHQEVLKHQHLEKEKHLRLHYLKGNLFHKPKKIFNQLERTKRKNKTCKIIIIIRISLPPIIAQILLKALIKILLWITGNRKLRKYFRKRSLHKLNQNLRQ